MPELPEAQETTRGTRIHTWLSGQKIELTPEELETAETIRELTDSILREEFPNGCTLHFETRLWMRLGQLMHSGQPDLLARTGSKVVILDYKTGWGFVPGADTNQQLRDLAVLAWDNYGVSPIRVAKIQPTTKGRAYLCEYNAEDLERSVADVSKRVTLCHDENAPRIPGPVQCQYCRFRPRCPEAKETVTNLPALIQWDKQLSDGASIARWLDACAVAKKIIKDHEENAKRLLSENPDAIPGWELKPGNKVRAITDPETVASRFTKEGGQLELFMQAVRISIGDMKEVIRGATGLKGKSLDAKLDALIEGCYEERQNEPSLKRT
jgi:hypothetical protein